MVNPKQTTADLLSLDVTYLGQNGVKQHLFSNGAGGLATHVFTTLEEAVERFGKRIKVEPKHYVQSVNFKQGYASNSYAPRPNADRVERIEYGMGYLKRLIEKAQTAKVVAKPVDMRLPHEVFQDKAKAGKVPQTPNPAPPTFKAPPLQTPPEPKEDVASRLAASRAALLSPVIEPQPDENDLEIPEAPEPVVPKTDLAASIGNIAKKRGPKPKAQ